MTKGTEPVDLQHCQKKLKSLSDDLELFAHITSHDLKDPMRQILYLCEEYMNGTSENEPKTLLTGIAASAKMVIRRIELLREFSYIANAKQISGTPVDCNAILQQAKEALKQPIEATGAVITAKQLPTVLGSDKQILKLFTHLLDNAIRFRSNEPPKITCSAERQDGMWKFRIADNGIGIDPVYRNLIFALFQRIDPLREDGSFGVGLPFCKKIVENHGGDISFEANGEQGTCFYFTLPAIK